MLEDATWQLKPLKRFAPTLIGFSLGCLVFYPRLVRGHGLSWLLLHSLCGPFETPVYVESAGLTHSDVLFGGILLFMMWSHVFSMRRAGVILSLVGSFLWVAAALGHYA